MNVDLKKNFPLESNADDAWGLLRNIESVANCMPGAEITKVVDDENFEGKVKVRLGPVNMEFNGTIAVKSVDAASQQIQLMASGKDKKGTSTVSMDLTANIEADGGVGSALLGDAKVVVDGKLASFGQRMMAQVSDQILDQFADNFRTELKANQQAASNDGVDVDSSNSHVSQSETINDSAEMASSEPQARNNEINGFKFALTALLGYITGFFKRK